MNGTQAYVLSKKFTTDTADSLGSLKGAPCTIKSKVAIDGGTRITFSWTGTSGTEQTETVDIMDGVDGKDGLGIKSVAIDANNHLIITYDDDTTEDAGEVTTVKGDKGVGVPEGGTAGQVLVKKSSTDYDTEWDTPAGGGDMLKSVYDKDNDGKVNSAENADTVNGHTVAKNVPADAVFTDTVYDDTEIRGEIADKVDKVDGKGLSTNDYTNADKAIVDGVTSALSDKVDKVTGKGLSTNDYSNADKAIVDGVTSALAGKANVADLATVATSGDYEDLTNTPSIPSKTSDLTNDSNFATTSDVSTALADYTTTNDLTTLLAGKQDTLTFDNAPTENSNNPVKSGGVYSAEADIFAVMGQNGAKNLIPYDIDAMKAVNVGGTWSGNEYTYNGITFAVNSDGTITVSGIASALTRLAVTIAQFENGKAYTMTGCPEGGNHVNAYTLYTQTVQNYDDGEGVTFNWSSSITSIAIAIFSGVDLTTPITFKPMLRLASDTDTTYQPYSKTNQELTAETQALTNQANDMVNVLGAKNLIPFPYHRQSGYTTNNATFTYDDEGVITVNKVAGNATAYFGLFSNTLYPNAEIFIVPNTSYILSMELENATDTSCFVQTQNGIDLAAIRNKATGKYEISFTTPETMDFLAVSLYYGAATTENNAKVKLMIRLASIEDATYQPYAKTNQQLTEDSVTWDNLSKVGAVNLLQNNATTQTINGVTFTVNSDGTIIANGANTSTSSFGYEIDAVGDNFVLPAGSYKLTGCPSNGGDKTWRLQAYKTDGTTVVAIDNGNGATFTLEEPTQLVVKIRIGGSAGSGTLTNLTFKPMITVPSYNGDYVPYAKSNKELTEDVTSLDAMYDGKAPSAVSDLNVPLTAGGASVAITRHLNNTTNAPTNGGGLEITWSSSDKYGAQLTLTDGGLYFRTNSGGTISAWQKIST